MEVLYSNLTGNESDFITYDLENGTLNANNTTEPNIVPYEQRIETYLLPLIFAIIFIVGVVGNGTLIIVFLRHRAMRNIPNTYILSLAIADLLVITTTVPLTSVIYIVNSWPWGSFLCTLSEFFKDVSIGVSVFTLCALSGDRFFAIVDPLRKFHHGGGKRATRMTIAIALAIWVLAIICGIPAIRGSYIKVFEISKTTSFAVCYPFPEEWGLVYAQTIVMGRFLIYYAIPLSIIALFYIMIARHLIHSASTLPGEMQGAHRQVKARKKVAVTVLTFVGLFGLCFMPGHIFMIWFYYNPNSQLEYNAFWHILRMVGFCLAFANSCANPVALYCVSGAFRKHFNRYLFCRNSSNSRNRTTCDHQHREASLTSTISRRYPSRHYTLSLRRIQETSVTTFPNGTTLNGNGLKEQENQL